MTQQYWIKYRNLVANDLEHTQNKLWAGVRSDLNKNKEQKHHLQLYSMCKSDNPYIRQIKSSPNITSQTVAEMICRDKACQLQYCMSLMKVANQNRRRLIDLKGCKDQYNTMRNCISSELYRVQKQQQKLRNLVHGIKVEVDIQMPEQKVKQKSRQVYI